MVTVGHGGVRDFVSLLKPRVMSLVVFTAVVALAVAPVSVHPIIAFAAILSIATGAGAAGALNMWYDADIDRVMSRTRERPIPSGAVAPSEALAFGMVLAVFSVLVLGLATNWLAAALLAFTIFFYGVVYTMWLKRATPQNIVIGGAAGAFPPVIAWAAATGTVSIEPIVLFLIIFFWTPPHFWALALVRSGDYARAGVPMLPVVSGAEETRRQILLYSLVLVPLGLAPVVLGFGGWLYLAVSLGLGAIFLVLAWKLRSGHGDAIGPVARRLFGFSIVYLFGLFAALLAEHVLGLPGQETLGNAFAGLVQSGLAA
ncbi:heme o synthase [Microbaculum marinum]|uniref:Protoheme IX farnesyltransferase n=2 Tax=Microbaculum marinum TaxID=1764581 RepID=A0AAW9RHV1_9HYPH